MLYFYFSFGYVVLRICLLSIFGGWLYGAGRAAVPILHVVPTEIYNKEVRLVIDEIVNKRSLMKS